MSNSISEQNYNQSLQAENPNENIPTEEEQVLPLSNDHKEIFYQNIENYLQ